MILTAVVLAAVSAAAGGGSSLPMSPSEEQRIDKQIETRLRNDPDLRGNRIQVEVEQGIATLKGRVDDEAARARAQDLAYVNGVTHVADWLLVSEGGPNAGMSDHAVTAELLAQYRPDKTLDSADLSVTTNHGVVTLEGIVPSETARRRAVQIAEGSKGVKRVEDHLRIAGETKAIFRNSVLQ